MQYRALVKVDHPDHGAIGAYWKPVGRLCDSPEAAMREAINYSEITWPLDAGRRYHFMQRVKIKETQQ